MNLTMPDLEQAINYWRNLRPSVGDESALSAEVNALATTYALMIFHRHSSVPVSDLPPRVQDLISTWQNNRQ